MKRTLNTTINRLKSEKNNEHYTQFSDIGNAVRSLRTCPQNNLNQLTSSRQVSASSAPPREPTYDLDGNMLSDGVLSFTYDAANRLKTVSTNGVQILANYYDAETGLYYYGYRFYHPTLMRWLNRIEQVFVLTLFAGCANFNRISEMPDVLALSLVHGEVVVECPLGGNPDHLYDDGFIRVWQYQESSVACAEIQTSSKACQLTDAITACLRQGVKKLVLFWSGADCVVNDDMTLEPCAMPLCPAVNLDSFSGTLVSINVVRGNCIFVNGREMTSEKDLEAYFRTVKCSEPNAEVVIRPDRKSHVSSLRRIVNACTSNGIWNVFLAGKNNEDECVIYPINIPCPNGTTFTNSRP